MTLLQSPMTAKTEPVPSLPPIDTLQVVFKIAERCNINCTYCYYFNMGETSALSRPALVSDATVQDIAAQIASACVELGISYVKISFHGGEPMMIGSDRFGQICKTLIDAIRPHAALSLSMQTNGTVSIEKWVPYFSRYSVSVSFSIDGNKNAHDRYRLSKAGGSTFRSTERNLKKAIFLSERGVIHPPATISVLDSYNSYRNVYRYLRQLGVKRMTFLLPDRNADGLSPFSKEDAIAYGRALFDVFLAWFEEDDPSIRVRHIDQFLGRLLGAGSSRNRIEELREVPCVSNRAGRQQIIIARSDGTFALNDSFIPALSWYKSLPTISSESGNLAEFLSHEAFAEVARLEAELPHDCESCEWQTLCGGGDLENRFTEERGFNNRSVYCESYLLFFDAVRAVLVSNGVSEKIFESALIHTRPDCEAADWKIPTSSLSS